MSEADSSNTFHSARNLWQQRATSGGNAGPSQKVRNRENLKINNSTPPLSPSSRKDVHDPFQIYGISFNAECDGLNSSGVLTIRKLIPGGSADLAGGIFPGDVLNDVNGVDVYGCAEYYFIQF